MDHQQGQNLYSKYVCLIFILEQISNLVPRSAMFIASLYRAGVKKLLCYGWWRALDSQGDNAGAHENNPGIDLGNVHTNSFQFTGGNEFEQ